MSLSFNQSINFWYNLIILPDVLFLIGLHKMLLLSRLNSTIIYIFPQNYITGNLPAWSEYILRYNSLCKLYSLAYTTFPFLLFWLILRCQNLLLLIALLIVAHIWSFLRVPTTSRLTLGIIMPRMLHLARARMRIRCRWCLRFMMVWLEILPLHDSSAPDQDLFSIYRHFWLIVMVAVVGFSVCWMVVFWIWRFLCWYYTRQSHSHQVGCATFLCQGDAILSIHILLFFWFICLLCLKYSSPPCQVL